MISFKFVLERIDTNQITIVIVRVNNKMCIIVIVVVVLIVYLNGTQQKQKSFK